MKALRKAISGVLVPSLLLLLLTSVLFGQASYTAQIRGVITDQTGAVVSSATVTITNDGTGIASTVKTNDEGLYILTGLRPAGYTMKVEAPGFQAVERKGIVLGVDQQTSINLTLAPAGGSTTVVVVGNQAPLLDTESANLGTDVTNQYVHDIPLYNRSIFGLVFLASGVTETTGSGITDNYPSGTNFVSNGQRNATAEVRLDGNPISAPEQGEGGNSNVYYQPSVEIVQEFKLQNNSFSAEFGNNGGTVMNVVLKQGTNKYHGSGWWYGQRSNFDAKDFFNSGDKPDHVRDQYGFAIGGPVVKNKTFFFADFEKVRQSDPVNIEARVPTAEERLGDFSNSGTPIFDPKNCITTNPCTRAPFAGNIIPSAEIDPIGQAIINLYPEPNIAGTSFPDPNFRTVLLSHAPAWQFDVKLDHQINDKHKIGGRYSRHHDSFTVPTVFGDGDSWSDGVIYKTDVQNGGAEYNYLISPTVLWTSRVGLDRVKAPGISNNYPTLESVGLPSILNANGLDRMPTIITDDFGNNAFTSLFTQCCVDTHFAHTLFTYSSAVQWTHRSHSFRFGGEQRLFYNNFWQPNYPSGLFNFSRDVTTSQPNAGKGDEGEGNAFATLLTGFPYGGELNIVPAVADMSKETAFFVQDDWKVSPKLTLNLGLRYEWSTPYSERFNRSQFSDFNGDSGINLPGLGEIKGTTVFAGSGKRTAPVDRNNFAPRFGFAYQLAPNTVVRGGAGVFYGMSVATNFQYAGTAFRRSATIHATKDSFDNQFASLANPFPDGLSGPQGQKYGKLAQWGFSNENDLGTDTARNAEIYQWNLGVQHLLPGQIVVAVDYSANRSTHLPWAGTAGTRNRNFLSSAARKQAFIDKQPNQSVTDYLNELVPNPFQPLFVAGPDQIFNEPDSIYNDAEIPRINLLRPYPQFDGSFTGLPLLAASAWYHALQFRFQKRASHYISFEGSYTFSKATDDSSSGANAWIGGLAVDNPQELDNLKAEHSISANDTPHRFTTAFILDVPVGRGRWIGRGMSPVVDGIIGGWALQSFITLQSGQPLAIQMSSPLLADGTQRPNVVCNKLRTGISFTQAALSSVAGNSQPYLNPDCFADPGDNVVGNAPRFFSNLRGPGIRNLDLSLSKEFTIREDMKLQIRAEMFNATNTPRFAVPATGWGSEDFGTVTSTRGNARKMQFGARFQF